MFYLHFFFYYLFYLERYKKKLFHQNGYDRNIHKKKEHFLLILLFVFLYSSSGTWYQLCMGML